MLFILLSGAAWGANPLWTWVKGDKVIPDRPIYGTKGVPAPGNHPGCILNAASWVDLSGRFWVFGGSTTDASGNVVELNDLWRFDPSTKLWTWFKGSGGSNPKGVYGTQGTAAAGNTPGARSGATAWLDQGNGRLYLFGGYGYDATGDKGYLNDFWIFDPATGNWTWRKGANLKDQAGDYGTQGVRSSTSMPRARSGAAVCMDGGGHVFLFGGACSDATGRTLYLNDLWYFDQFGGSIWVWLKGAKEPNQTGVYGVQGTAATANTPGGRTGAAFSGDGSGRIWLFGGSGYAEGASIGVLSDLWCFNTDTLKWTWISGSNKSTYDAGVYGTQGQANVANRPGSRMGAAAWPDAYTGLGFWLFGGSADGVLYNDLWMYDTTSKKWTWMRGASLKDQSGVYGTQGQPDVANTPGARQSFTCAATAGITYLWGGEGYDAEGHWVPLRDLWRQSWSAKSWTWIAGPSVSAPVSAHGSLGAPAAANSPGKRVSAATWTDPAGRFWLFGGEGYDAQGKYGGMNDLWRLDPATNLWTWVKGPDSLGNAGQYGASLTSGVTDPAIQPGWRKDAATWTDASGRLWLFGGEGFASSSTLGMLNDLWRFDPATGNWSWVKGSWKADERGVYGTQGTAAPDNTPGGRSGAAAWTDPSGQFWLFGGGGMSDLWRFDPVSENWTWVKGANTANQAGVYGQQGTAAAGNAPGARSGSATWTDPSGRLWLFGGSGKDAAGVSGYLDDLWRYDPATGDWTWIKGSSYKGQSPAYGALGQAAPACTPGSRAAAAGWVDSSGRLWLYGGNGSPTSGANGRMSDLWRFDPLTMNWAWCGGSKQPSETIVHGTKGKAALANTPGARYGSARWTDCYGRFWFYSGGENGLDDLWLLAEPNGVDQKIWGMME